MNGEYHNGNKSFPNSSINNEKMLKRTTIFYNDEKLGPGNFFDDEPKTKEKTTSHYHFIILTSTVEDLARNEPDSYGIISNTNHFNI